MVAEKQYYPKPNTYYYIIAKRNNKVLEGNPLFEENGANVQIGTKSNSYNQQWSFVLQDDGKYLILNRKTGKQLDVEARSMENGAAVQLWETTQGGQQWTLDPVEGSCCRIRSVHAGKVLDIVGLSDYDGANIQIWECAQGDNQLWELVETDREVENTKVACFELEKKSSSNKAKTANSSPSKSRTRSKNSSTASTAVAPQKRSSAKKEK